MQLIDKGKQKVNSINTLQNHTVLSEPIAGCIACSGGLDAAPRLRARALVIACEEQDRILFHWCPSALLGVGDIAQTRALFNGSCKGGGRSRALCGIDRMCEVG